MKFSGVAVAQTVAGFVLVWSGIRNEPIGATLRDLLKGKNPPAVPETPPAIGTAPGGAAPAVSAAPAAPGSLTANQTLGRMLAAAYGWTGAEWDALYALWSRESGWSATAQNPQSGAYGIPQALPYTKMPRAGWPPSAGGAASAPTQIAWGLSYIKARYGTPSAAWAHEQAEGWY